MADLDGAAIQLITGDCREVLRSLPAESVQTCVTSPPYWGLRDYGLPTIVWGGDAKCEHEWGEDIPGDARGGSGPNAKECYGGQDGESNYARKVARGNVCCLCCAWRGALGLEPTPELYVEHIVEVFREVRRVLRNDGTLWLNLGDSYSSNWPAPNTRRNIVGNPRSGGKRGPQRQPRLGSGLKEKDLIGMPWRVAFALQADGWWLRSDIIWAKPSPMPESVRDRPTRSHEYVFLLSKSARYFFDQEAVLEPVSPNTHMRISQNVAAQVGSSRAYGGAKTNGPMKAVVRAAGVNPKAALGEQGREKQNPSMAAAICLPVHQRNIRSVWTIPTQPTAEAHFATFPEALVEPCVKAGTSERGCCAECGAAWVRLVAAMGTRKVAPSGRPSKVALDATDGTHHHADAIGANSSMMSGEIPIQLTVGWQPTCKHEGEPVPCRVLDPFSGAGTTGVVAVKLRRCYVGIDLSADYNAIAKRRIERAIREREHGVEPAKEIARGQSTFL